MVETQQEDQGDDEEKENESVCASSGEVWY